MLALPARLCKASCQAVAALAGPGGLGALPGCGGGQQRRQFVIVVTVGVERRHVFMVRVTVCHDGQYPSWELSLGADSAGHGPRVQRGNPPGFLAGHLMHSQRSLHPQRPQSCSLAGTAVPR
jgi:hypothetical protein